jgi:type III secretory pathway component EscU
MKLVSISIIIGSIIISIVIFYSVTHEERARMQYCKDNFARMAKENGTASKLKSMEEEIKLICANKVYGR